MFIARGGAGLATFAGDSDTNVSTVCARWLCAKDQAVQFCKLRGRVGMQRSAMSCPECEGEMEMGFILDMMNGAVWPQKWAKGAPKKSWWGGLKVKWDECRAVETLRCTSCGFLKSYAR